MPLSQEKIEAYKKLDEAVEALTKAYHADPDLEAVPVGYLLLVGETSFIKEDDPDYEPEGDADEVRAVCGVYSKRGQNPIFSYGLAHEYVRHYND